jgi:hypothetical protein
VISASGTSPVIAAVSPGRGLVPVMWPRRLERSPVRSPIAASGATISIVDDGLQHDRIGGADGLDGGLAAGGDKGDVLAVHRMGFAVIDDDADVLRPESRPITPSASAWRTPFSTERHEDAGNRAALDVVDEFETGAALQRLDLQVHLAELAGAARLLLVPAMSLGVGR